MNVINGSHQNTTVSIEQPLQQRVQELERERARLQHMLDAAPTLVYTYDLVEQRNIYSNQEIADLLGYSPTEVQQMGSGFLQTLMHPDDFVRYANHFAHLLAAQDGEVVEFDYRMRRKDGSWVWFLSRDAIFQRAEDGFPTKIIGVVHDITVRKHQENDLRMFKALAENAPDGIIVSDLDNLVTYINESFSRMTGYGGEEIGKHIYKFYAEDHDNLENVTRQVLLHGAWQGQFAYQRKDGSTFQGQLSIFTILNQEGKPAALARIVRDLTEQQQIQQERAQLQSQVIEAQRKALRELSTPLIPLTDHVVLMPIIGAIDSQRAQLVMDALLEGIAAHRADIAILDITGVEVVDSQVANALIQAAQAATLLGAQVLLTGIRPGIAQTLVHLGVSLQHMLTHGTLQSGIAYALKHQRSRQ